MRVGIISSAEIPPLEGIGHFIVNLGRQLRAKGHEVVIFSRARGLTTKLVQHDGIKIVKAPFLPFYPFHVHFHRTFLHKELLRYKNQLDVLDFQSPLVPAIDLGLPSVATIHTLMVPAAQVSEIGGIRPLIIRLQSYLISRRIEENLFQQSPICCSVRPIESRELTSYRVKPKKIVCVGVGVHEKFLEPVDYLKRNDPPIIFYAGRLDYTKGLFTLVRSIKYVVQERPKVRFVLAGHGPIKNALEQTAIRDGILEYIDFLGPIHDRNQMRTLHMSATIYVQPSYFEGIPASILEAMACGTPIVYTDIPGARHLISSQEGILVPPGDPEKLAVAILTMLSDEPKRVQMGVACREKVINNYTWDIVSERIISAYEESRGIWRK